MRVDKGVMRGEYNHDCAVYYRARYYDPTVGRFLSEDPIRFWGGIDFYKYVDNNPTDLADPSGLCPTDCDQKYNQCLANADAWGQSCSRWAWAAYGLIEAGGAVGGTLVGGPFGTFAGLESADLPAAAAMGIIAANCSKRTDARKIACSNQYMKCK